MFLQALWLKNSQIVKLFKGINYISVLEAADRKAVGPVIAGHERSRAVKVQVASVGTGHRRTPVEAAAADTDERRTAGTPVAACG